MLRVVAGYKDQNNGGMLMENVEFAYRWYERASMGAEGFGGLWIRRAAAN
jgi:hypothetical protein